MQFCVVALAPLNQRKSKEQAMRRDIASMNCECMLTGRITLQAPATEAMLGATLLATMLCSASALDIDSTMKVYAKVGASRVLEPIGAGTLAHMESDQASAVFIVPEDTVKREVDLESNSGVRVSFKHGNEVIVRTTSSPPRLRGTARKLAGSLTSPGNYGPSDCWPQPTPKPRPGDPLPKPWLPPRIPFPGDPNPESPNDPICGGRRLLSGASARPLTMCDTPVKAWCIYEWHDSYQHPGYWKSIEVVVQHLCASQVVHVVCEEYRDAV